MKALLLGLECQNQFSHLLRIRIGYMRLARHDVLTPDPCATRLDLCREGFHSAGFTRILRSNLLEYGTVFTLVDLMARGAVIPLKQVFEFFVVCVSQFDRKNKTKRKQNSDNALHRISPKKRAALRQRA